MLLGPTPCVAGTTPVVMVTPLVQGSVYETCLKTASCGDDATTLYPSNPELPGDR